MVGLSIRVGIVGTGFGATVHAPILARHPAYDLSAIASQRPGRAAEAASTFQIPHAYDDWKQMLEQAPIDLVVFATRPADHKLMTLSALSSDLHVLCEKPPALNLVEARAMEQASKSSDRVTAMNFEWRYLPERKAVKRLLNEGVLGKILHVSWSEAWQIWGRIQEFEPGWDSDAEQGGGMLGAIGSHIIDSLCHWLGEVSAVKGTIMNRVPTRKTADDSFSFVAIFENEITCSVSCTVASVGCPPRIEIFGTNGTLIISGHQLLIATIRSPNFIPVSVEETMDVSDFPAEIQGYVHAQWHLYSDLAQSIAGQNIDSLPNLTDGVHVQTVMDSIRS